MPNNEKILAFPIYPGVTPLELIGPLTVLKTPGIGDGATAPSLSASAPSRWPPTPRCNCCPPPPSPTCRTRGRSSCPAAAPPPWPR